MDSKLGLNREMTYIAQGPEDGLLYDYERWYSATGLQQTLMQLRQLQEVPRDSIVGEFSSRNRRFHAMSVFCNQGGRVKLFAPRTLKWRVKHGLHVCPGRRRIG
jgi:hypothetical protein